MVSISRFALIDCSSPEGAESDAMGLYETYISLLAENPLPLDEQTRLQVERNICRDDGIIRPDSFQVAQDFVFRLMEQKWVCP